MCTGGEPPINLLNSKNIKAIKNQKMCSILIRFYNQQKKNKSNRKRILKNASAKLKKKLSVFKF